MKDMESFVEILQRVVDDTVRDRVATWAKYQFEKEMLPTIVEEATKRVRVEVYSNANIPEEIRLRVRFDKNEGKSR